MQKLFAILLLLTMTSCSYLQPSVAPKALEAEIKYKLVCLRYKGIYSVTEAPVAKIQTPELYEQVKQHDRLYEHDCPIQEPKK